MRPAAITMLSVALAATACGATPLPAPRTPADTDWGPALVAGVDEVDITPPPGLALFGHGFEGRIAMGTRLRLSCRVFFFAKGPEAVALVPCELGAMSLELQRTVSDRVMRAGVALGADRIVLTATHTHAGPAHYFGPRMYSSSFSSRRAGFDAQVLDFLATRIAASVVRAVRGRAPARVGWAFAQVSGLTRNRSFGAFARNRELPPELERVLGAQARETGAVPSSEPHGPSPAELAVDERLSVLRVDRDSADGAAVETLGVLAVFGMHQTAVPATNDLYHGDVFGYATRFARSMLAAPSVSECASSDVAACAACAPVARAGGPIVGIANGIEGDVSPAWDFQAQREARRLGFALAAHLVAAATSAEPTASAEIARAYRELTLPNARADASGARLCEHPELGAAAAGGAEDGPTRLRIVPQFNEGARAETDRGCHGHRLGLVSPSGEAAADGVDFPAMAPLVLARIGNGIVLAAPAELTTVTGLRARAAVQREIDRLHVPGIDGVTVTGLANTYLQYVTTAEEFDAQHYEGASTLYGPRTARFLEWHSGCLARWLLSPAAQRHDACGDGQPPIGEVGPASYDPDNVVHRLASESGAAPEPIETEDLPPREVTDEGVVGYSVAWRGLDPDHARSRSRLEVSIECVDLGSAVDDDRGANVELRYGERDGDAGWTATWWPPFRHPDAHCGRRYRFRIRGHAAHVSEPFTVHCARPSPGEAAQ